MKNRINLLDEITINKIAAGEVVERPSSIVKELVENSIDAGADRIIIEVENGGKSLIKITDNGCGIPSSEVKKCFLRHATSKIDKIDDLFNLFTLGFRGEALASICAVSKLEMTTKFEDEAVGTKITLVGGNIEAKEAVGANTGTSIVIKDLFFNTPARKKFLKTDHAELMNITDIVNKLAIGYPNVKFRYLNAGKLMVNTPGDGKLVSAVRSIYSREVSENLIEINYDCSLFKIDGYIGNNNIYRSNRNLQHIYINGRFVKSKIIYDAIANAYKSIIPINKHAVCFINLHLDPQKVDVNIHPGKIEVKFEKENEIKLEIMEYIRAKLLKQSLIGKYETFDRVPKDRAVKQDFIEKNNFTTKQGFIEKTDFNNNTFKNQDFGNASQYSNEMNSKIDDKEIKPIDLSDEVDVNSFIKLDDFEEKKKKEVKTKSSGFKYNNDTKLENNNKISETESQMAFTAEGEILDSEKKEAGFSLKYYKVVGVVFDTYIVLQKGESMYLMDQHAAHERVLFERYMNAFHKREVHMQMLLDPIVLELSSVDMLQVEKNLDIFRNFGFEVEIFGMNNILIRGVPNLFGTPQSEKFILELIDNIDKISNNYDLKDDRFAIMACKSAIKANDRIQNIEIESLFKQLEKCENPYTCPHGRPTMVEISKVEIEKMFKRIM
ncbi:DNA mismatch repair endonuclease MutL [Peptacetobacter hiranonis]|uniref:DNA mismatch repair protein MutL n=1 Tax=Peptacetobacter hiranonis (strain DSM 13275 / JCM 10541 / KCTC 15199 / TO-931) TaxID=500633 RepID=B6FXF2_PEPHT|nr:DNA mismatch repair endonuclease MutL [Peptacetobacter hiranonis]EEA85802.1 DNA mismatch repair domain protein [Peptacetobacter hiranonis DSM 13275]QEK20587.1 DNA mismatch repair protein MutL [Peptacetobacter hiranonis]